MRLKIAAGASCCSSQRLLLFLIFLLLLRFLLRQDVSGEDPKAEFDVDAPSGVVMEGYLFKRASNAFKTWNR